MPIGQTRLDEHFKRVKLLKEGDAWIKSFDSKTKEQIIEWVKDQLLSKGVDGRGIVIGEYSYATELITNGEKRQGDHYTLKDKGRFYDSFEIYVSEFLFEVTGDGKKGNDNLYQKYGEYITTLTDENIQKLREIIKGKYIEYARRILQLD